MKISGTHLVAELAGCDRLLLNDENKLKAILADGIRECGLTLVQMSSHKFTPVGVTVIAIISESHVALHTFPEAGHASLDIYHCTADTPPLHLLLTFLKTHFSATEVSHLQIARGSKLATCQ